MEGRNNGRVLREQDREKEWWIGEDGRREEIEKTRGDREGKRIEDGEGQRIG